MDKTGNKSKRLDAGKVITMPVQETKLITDAELKSLFLGLVRLVKRSALEEVSLNLKRECEFANTTLRNTLIDLRRKDRVLEEFKLRNAQLAAQNKELNESLAKIRSENLSLKLKREPFAASRKTEKLKVFLEDLKPRAEQSIIN